MNDFHSKKYSEKVFEFSKFLDANTQPCNSVQVIQVGETCLDKGACIEEHTQPCHEITYVISGEGTLKADNEEVRVSVGDVQLISKNVLHTIIASKDKPLRYIHFAFDFVDFEPRALADFYETCRHVMIHDSGDIRGVLNLLVDEYFNGATFTEIAKSALVQLILVMIWRKIHFETQKYRPETNAEPLSSTVFEIIKYIDSHISEKLSVDSIAEHVSYSSTYISRLFKEKTGSSLKEYIVARKMRFAESLLLEGKSSLSEISSLVGYESTQSFCKIFKKYTGKTPGEMKKNTIS